MIREVYDNDNSEEMFLMELERAFQVGCRSIVIEPTDLAKETARWIKAGSFIKKVSVGSGVTALVVGNNKCKKYLGPNISNDRNYFLRQSSPRQA